jgi:dihydroxyacetone kinase
MHQKPGISNLKLAEPSRLNNIVRRGCERAIAAEPNLTKWDMVMGDGDCGEAVEGVSKAVLKTLDLTTKTGSIFDLLYATIDNVDDMGGTLGAIFGIFLSALTTNLRSRTSSSPNYATATAAAVTALKQYTGAREGDRTVMDVLLPFAATFEETGDFAKAVAVAQEKAEATRYLKPKFGRASYVGAGGKEQELPDPGAWALKEMLVGMLEGAE